MNHNSNQEKPAAKTEQRKVMPTLLCTDKRFRYINSEHTNIAKTFERFRKAEHDSKD